MHGIVGRPPAVNACNREVAGVEPERDYEELDLDVLGMKRKHKVWRGKGTGLPDAAR